MTSPTAPASRWKEPGVTQYLVVCLGALVVIFLLLVQRGFADWSLVLFLAGLAASVTRLGPLVLPLALVLLINFPLSRSLNFQGLRSLDLADLVLCGAVLAYVMAHFRLQSLVIWVFPPEGRGKKLLQGSLLPSMTRRPSRVRERRAARLVTRQEIGLVVVLAPAWAALAQIFWRVFPSEWGNPGMHSAVWRAVLLVWFIGLVTFGLGWFIDYGRRQQMTAEEGLVFLQDVYWNETRREQRRLNRWLAWAKLRRQRSKDPKKGQQ